MFRLLLAVNWKLLLFKEVTVDEQFPEQLAPELLNKTTLGKVTFTINELGCGTLMVIEML